MDYKDALDWLYSFRKFGSKLGLERISYLVERLGNPHWNYKVIHVSGTNGKGSVCNFIGSILQKAGYRVGVYISPHLQRFSERIVVNGKEIAEQDVALLVEKIKPIVDDMIQKQQCPTFFEIVTAMAFQHLSNCTVEYAVVEVGLGGRFDATNVVSPILSVITNISLEHTDVLGENIACIASEKAGIIKTGVPVITAAKNDACKTIEQVAREHKAPVIIVRQADWKRANRDIGHQEFVINGCLTDYRVKTSLLGEYQGENIALAIATVEQLQMNGVYIPNSCVADGISATANPGRMEILSVNPLVLLEGAHNPVGMRMLEKALREDFAYDTLVLVLGILSDKDIQGMLSIIVPYAGSVIVTKSRNPRAYEPRALWDMIKKIGYDNNVYIEDMIPKAVDHAQSLADANDLICITGSLFTVGEARSYLLCNAPGHMVECMDST